MGQVMRFHEFPNGYNWTAMPLNIGSLPTSNLLRDIGDAVNMQYGCAGSGAYMSDVAPAFLNDFGYTSATLADYNYQVVKQQIGWNRPVVLAGGTHAWVCDGYRTYTTCSTGSLFLHMNWGWGGQFDGYFAYGDWSPGTNNYNTNKKMVYNIVP
jgi:hypothetical protein